MSANTTFIIAAVLGAWWGLIVFPVFVSLTVGTLAGKNKTEPFTDKATSEQGVKANAHTGSYFFTLLRVTTRSSIQTALLMSVISFALLTLFGSHEVGAVVASSVGGFYVAIIVRLAQHFTVIRASIRKHGTLRIVRNSDGTFKIGDGSE